MNGRYWDWNTFLLYIVLSYITYYLITHIIRNGSTLLPKGTRTLNTEGKILYISLFVILIFFTAFREVSFLIGGADAPIYN